MKWGPRGVTHWHLVRSDFNSNDRNLSSAEHIASERVAREREVAWEPTQVVSWLTAQRRYAVKGLPQARAALERSGLVTREAWLSRQAVWLTFAEQGDDVCTLQSLGTQRVARINAYAVTGTRCCTRESEAEA